MRWPSAGATVASGGAPSGEWETSDGGVSEDLEAVADALEASWYASPRPSRPDVSGPDGRIRIVLDAPAALLTMNAAKSTHYREWAKLTASWREAMCSRALLLGIPRQVGRVGVEAHPYQAGGVLADAGAHMPCVKACVDGLRDAEVLPDDDPDHVGWVLLFAPVKGAGAGMQLDLVPL